MDGSVGLCSGEGSRGDSPVWRGSLKPGAAGVTQEDIEGGLGRGQGGASCLGGAGCWGAEEKVAGRDGPADEGRVWRVGSRGLKVEECGRLTPAGHGGLPGGSTAVVSPLQQAECTGGAHPFQKLGGEGGTGGCLGQGGMWVGSQGGQRSPGKSESREAPYALERWRVGDVRGGVGGELFAEQSWGSAQPSATTWGPTAPSPQEPWGPRAHAARHPPT